MEGESSKRKHGGEIIEEESLTRNHLVAVVGEESWERNPGGGIKEADPVGKIVEEEAWRSNH